MVGEYTLAKKITNEILKDTDALVDNTTDGNYARGKISAYKRVLDIIGVTDIEVTMTPKIGKTSNLADAEGRC